MKNFSLPLVLCALALAGCADKTSPTPTAPLAVDTPEAMAPAAANAAAPDATSDSKMSGDAMANRPGMATNSASSGATGKPKTYRVRGQVVEVPAGGAFVVVKHETVPDFMPAMQMRLPLRNAAAAAKLKAGDKIAFDLNADNVEISNIETLPPSTQLKLSP